MLIEYSRMPPSSCAPETRKTFDHCGQGLAEERSSGGLGTISNWWTLRQPWRCEVPRQSAPVSPPPMMMTCLSSAVNWGSSDTESPATRRFWRGRNSIARWMPFKSRPGIGRSRARVGPAAEADGVKLGQQAIGGDVAADVDPRLEDDPFGLHLPEAAVDPPFLHLEVGNPVAEEAADPVIPLEDRHVVPGAGQLLRGSESGRAGADDRDRPGRS